MYMDRLVSSPIVILCKAKSRALEATANLTHNWGGMRTWTWLQLHVFMSWMQLLGLWCARNDAYRIGRCPQRVQQHVGSFSSLWCCKSKRLRWMRVDKRLTHGV